MGVYLEYILCSFPHKYLTTLEKEHFPLWLCHRMPKILVWSFYFLYMRIGFANLIPVVSCNIILFWCDFITTS